MNVKQRVIKEAVVSRKQKLKLVVLNTHDFTHFKETKK